MAQLLGNGQVKLNDGSVVAAAEGGWYDGRRVMGGQLLAPGEYEAGKLTSQEVNKQSDAAQGLASGTVEAYLASQRQAVLGSGDGGGLAGGGNTAGGSTAGGSGSSTLGGTGTGAINLQNIYDQAYQTNGIAELQKQSKTIQDQIDIRMKAVADAKSSINENPFYSEATRVGRIQKLELDAQNDIGNLTNQKAVIQGQIDSARADVETKLNIATKQFDINSSAAQQALTQFNTLLTAGALDNASASDLAQFASATGISSSMIASAVKLSKQKNTETKLIETTDDYGNVRVSLIEIKDGQMNVVNQQNLGAIAKTSNSSGGTAAEQKQAIAVQLVADAKSGVPLVDYNGGTDILKIYGPFLDANTIYNLYNANSQYGPAKEKLSDLAKYGVKDINKDPFNINPAPVQ